MTNRNPRTVMLVLAAVALAACGGGSPPGPPAPSPTAPSPAPGHRWPLHATVTLGPGGPRPASVTINVGGRVSFVNDDTTPHEIVSDPYLRHEDCPPLNQVGFLAPGQTRQSAIFEVVRDCGFHDHLDPAAVSGTVHVRIE
jgi:hypothetical protein